MANKSAISPFLGGVFQQQFGQECEEGGGRDGKGGRGCWWREARGKGETVARWESNLQKCNAGKSCELPNVCLCGYERVLSGMRVFARVCT